jgi:hypothetical protein
LRSILIILAIVVCGVALGGLSAWYSIQRPHGIGAINIGPWTAYPYAGADAIDPYTVARGVADGVVPLGAAEGLVFETETDSGGGTLLLECEYRVEGMTPPSRLWTLGAYDMNGKQARAALGSTSAKYSGAVVRYPDGSFMIQISRRPKPGNWLGVAGSGPFRMLLRLYDTPIAGSTGLSAPSMPTITRGECR